MSGDAQNAAVLFEHLDMEIRLLKRPVEGYRAMICEQNRIGVVVDVRYDGFGQGFAAGSIVGGDGDFTEENFHLRKDTGRKFLADDREGCRVWRMCVNDGSDLR